MPVVVRTALTQVPGAQISGSLGRELGSSHDEEECIVYGVTPILLEPELFVRRLPTVMQFIAYPGLLV